MRYTVRCSLFIELLCWLPQAIVSVFHSHNLYFICKLNDLRKCAQQNDFKFFTFQPAVRQTMALFSSQKNV